MITSTDILFTKHRLQDIVSYLEQSDVQSIQELIDDKGNTLLIHWAYRNKLSVIQALITYERKHLETEPEQGQNIDAMIQKWVNAKNKEGFTAAHYASNVGNLEILKYLKQQGANLRSCSNNDLNLLHLAAQGDKLNSMIQLSDIIELDSKDDQGWTPLHWAAQMGSESVVEFLLSNQIQINTRNKEGETALYIACKEGQTRIVRKLLIKGADRQIPNNQGSKPMDIALQYEFIVISRMLNNKYGIFDYVKFYLNTQVKYEPQQRNLCMPFVFVLTSVFVIVSAHILVQCPFGNYLNIVIPSAYYSLMFLIYFTFLTPPKPLESPSNYKALLDKLPICTQCKIPRIQRSYHCPICKTCVKQYDHHCPWINNCVGKRNVIRFNVFLYMLTIGIMECCTLSFFGVLKDDQFNSPLPLFNDGVWKTVRLVALCIDIFITVLFIIPLLYLVYIQTSNLFLNKTTFERFTKTGKQPIKMSTLGSSQHSILSTFHEADTCSFQNCMNMCKNEESKYEYAELREDDYNIDD